LILLLLEAERILAQILLQPNHHTLNPTTIYFSNPSITATMRVNRREGTCHAIFTMRPSLDHQFIVIPTDTPDLLFNHLGQLQINDGSDCRQHQHGHQCRHILFGMSLESTRQLPFEWNRQAWIVHLTLACLTLKKLEANPLISKLEFQYGELRVDIRVPISPKWHIATTRLML
jgi:hypothetical protein